MPRVGVLRRCAPSCMARAVPLPASPPGRASYGASLTVRAARPAHACGRRLSASRRRGPRASAGRRSTTKRRGARTCTRGSCECPLAPLHVAVASLGPACACRVAGRVRMPGVCRTHARSLAHRCEWCRSTHGWRAELEAHQTVRVGPHAQSQRHARTKLARTSVRTQGCPCCSRLHRRRQGRSARPLAHHLPRPASASSFQICRHAHLPPSPPAPGSLRTHRSPRLCGVH